jgi:Tfp pilus assembly protein PilF
LNDPTGAEEAYRHAIRLDPASGKVHGNLGAVLLAQKKIPESAAESQEALRLDPTVAEAHYNLGLALKSLNDPAGALAEFRRAIYLNSDDRMAVLNFRMNREMTVNALGGLEGVATAYRTAIRVNPDDAGAHGNLAWLLATGPNRLRDGAGAVRHATRACELAGWRDPVDIEVLAAAHAAAGDFDRAVEYQQKALSVPGYARQMGPSVRDRVDLYRRKMPYYDPELFRYERGPAPRVIKK